MLMRLPQGCVVILRVLRAGHTFRVFLDSQGCCLSGHWGYNEAAVQVTLGPIAALEDAPFEMMVVFATAPRASRTLFILF